MTKGEAKTVKITGYRVAVAEGASKHPGGVMILANPLTTCKKLGEIPKPPSPIDTCAMLLYPASEETYALRITGVYVPPAAEATAANWNPLWDLNIGLTARKVAT